MKSRERKYHAAIILGVCTLFWSLPAWANAGIMWFESTPGYLLAFVLVVWVESLLLSRRLGLSGRRARSTAFWVNLLSTVWGYPTLYFLKYPHRLSRSFADDSWSSSPVLFFGLAYLVTVLVELAILVPLAKKAKDRQRLEFEAGVIESNTPVDTRWGKIFLTVLLMNTISYFLLILSTIAMPSDWQLGYVRHPDGITGTSFLQPISDIISGPLLAFVMLGILLTPVFWVVHMVRKNRRSPDEPGT